MRLKPCVIFLIALVYVFLLCGPTDIFAGDTCEDVMGKAVSIQGKIQIKKEGKTEWQPLIQNDPFCSGDMIRSLPRSRAAITLRNGSTIRLDQNSTMSFEGLSDKKTFLLKLIEGAAHFFSTVPRSLKIATPFVNGAVEGTEILSAGPSVTCCHYCVRRTACSHK